MTANKRKHECAACGETFMNITAHMSHYMQMHDQGYKPRRERRMRKVSCWSCAKEMPVPDFAADQWWRCECGFELTLNWGSGQLRG